MRRFLQRLFPAFDRDRSSIDRIHTLRRQFARLRDSQLREAASKEDQLLPFLAIAAVAASRVLGQELFDVQLRGALALARGSIAEMQTGEGKTLAAVPAVAWYARRHQGVHVMTVNDYLARRDACWMGDVYRLLGLSVASVQQGMTKADRRLAYAGDITYATANEIGFDVLRDRLALRLDDQVHRPFAVAVIDEADSILIDEARIPLIAAGGSTDESAVAQVADRVVRRLLPSVHYDVAASGSNVALTDRGILAIESAFECGNLFSESNLRLHTAVQDSLEAHALLHRDVDYLLKDDEIQIVDEFKGRVAVGRRWPAGLHTAVEIKEGLAAKCQGTILGSTSIQHLVALYPRICGMTGTAATQSLEFLKVYGLRVEIIPTNRPLRRVDHPDAVFPTRLEKEQALLDEIRRVHATGQPILVGTASVEESERLGLLLADIPHRLLNARNDEVEAAIVAEAGQRGCVTISTNMAGRGTDIRLGDGVAALGGFSIIGTNRHESRRIDNQLRGRAGRQGDPGCSRFFVSLEDPLLTKYGGLHPRYRNDPATIQRLVEGRHLDQRLFLHGYDVPVEGQRHQIHSYRQGVLEGRIPCHSALAQLITLRTIDELWTDYLGRVTDFRAGIHLQSYSPSAPFFLSLDRREPHAVFLRQIHEWFQELETALPGEIARRLARAEAGEDGGFAERGAVWTYLTTDQPFGGWIERVLSGLGRALRRERRAE